MPAPPQAELALASGLATRAVSAHWLRHTGGGATGAGGGGGGGGGATGAGPVAMDTGGGVTTEGAG